MSPGGKEEGLVPCTLVPLKDDVFLVSRKVYFGEGLHSIKIFLSDQLVPLTAKKLIAKSTHVRARAPGSSQKVKQARLV